MKLLDCTLRDGGYYNNWDFPRDVVNEYLKAMEAIEIDHVEIGMRSLVNSGFKGAHAYTTDEYLCSLSIPKTLNLGVMINASEIVNTNNSDEILKKLFPNDAENSPVSLVRIACHGHEFVDALPVSQWLKDKGYHVGFNLMQAVRKSEEDIIHFATEAQKWPIDVLYFADSMGGMIEKDIDNLINWIRQGWNGDIGIHAHDNMGRALQNTLYANKLGVTWLDATITGMGRGPGNTQTEFLILEVCEKKGKSGNLVPLISLVNSTFKPMQTKYGWGTNPFYYMAGKYNIHPSYIQKMLSEKRYDEEDILTVIEQLKLEGGAKYNIDTMESAKEFYQGEPHGSWRPSDNISGKDVLIVGTGPSSVRYKKAIERYIEKNKLYVIALNTKKSIKEDLIDIRASCHPIRLLADCDEYHTLPQPLVTPLTMLPEHVQKELLSKETYDFGIAVKKDTFSFEETFAVLPSSLVIAYTLAIATSGKAKRILLTGLDGYKAGDSRNTEMDILIEQYVSQTDACPLFSITPTVYKIPSMSVFGPLD